MLKRSIKRVGLLILFGLDPCCEAIGVGRRFTLADLDPMSLAPIADKACEIVIQLGVEQACTGDWLVGQLVKCAGMLRHRGVNAGGHAGFVCCLTSWLAGGS